MATAPAAAPPLGLSSIRLAASESPKKATVTPTTRITVPTLREAARPPKTISNSLRKMPNGGIAPSARIAARNSGPLHGSRSSPPRTEEICLLPNFLTSTPAPMNALPLAAACARTCSSTPASATGAPKLTPMARIPMCSTLE